jgi:ABC-type Fe3+-hydroxamate transport system substrate-binding protein
MEQDGHDGLTRRETLKYGSVAVGGGLLAGCTGDGETGTSSPTGSGTVTGEGDTSSYTVSMAPMGDVEFDAVPEDVLVYSLLYADMAVAYGHGESVNSLGFNSATGGNTLDAYYERLDGVAFDYEDLTQLNTGNGGIQVEKELLYELGSDLHLADPCLVQSFDGWEAADVEEVRENIAPWFGNTFSRNHGQPPGDCQDRYQYYTLWEIAEKVAAVFREGERFDELRAVYTDLLDHIESNLPPEDDRPTVGKVIFVEETFYPSHINTPGFANAHVRPLGAVDAFADVELDYSTTYDYEGMLEVDPDVILHQFGIASYYDVDAIRETLSENSVASDISAVQNGRVYPSGTPVQGPLMNLFQLEMTAKQLYPEQFGEWPEYTHGEPYPEIPEDERLFDRERVAEIVAGSE